jgi:2-dehydropantoate 2-reductase
LTATVLIRGSGSVACILAERLHTTANVCIFTRWHERARALREGIVIGGPSGERVARIDAISDIAEVPHAVDVVILAVKTRAVAGACDELRAVINNAAATVVVQNGLGALEALEASAPAATVVPGITYISGTSIAASQVQESALGLTILGAREENRAAVQRVAGLFETAGLPIEVSDTWADERWKKLVAATSINGTAAVLGCSVGDLAGKSTTRRLVYAVAEETLRIAEAQGVAVQLDDLDAFLAERLEASTANVPSMAQDIALGRETETAHINGAVAELARASGTKAPLNWCLHSLIEARSQLAQLDEVASGIPTNGV